MYQCSHSPNWTMAWESVGRDNPFLSYQIPISVGKLLFPHMLCHICHMLPPMANGFRALFLNQWQGYHQWYLEWCRVVLTGLLDTCHPEATPGTWHNSGRNLDWPAEIQRMHFLAQKTSPVYPELLVLVASYLASQSKSNWDWCNHVTSSGILNRSSGTVANKCWETALEQ